MVPGAVAEEEFRDVMQKLVEAEERRYARFKGALRFEYREVALDLEVYHRVAVG
jgi:hypothetical protein